MGEHPCSYDFWMSVVSWGCVDLATLKLLAINSLKYALFQSEDDRNRAMQLWQQQWDTWIQDIVDEFSELDNNSN